MTSLPIINQGRSYYTGAASDDSGLQAQIDAINIHLAILDNQVTTNTNNITTNTNNISSITSEITSIDSQISTINSEITSINSHLSSIDGQLTIINNEINDIDDRITINSGEIYKSGLPAVAIPMNTGVFAILAATDTIAGVVGDFTNPSPGLLQYNGAGEYYNVSYASSLILNTTNSQVTLALFVNTTFIVPSAKQLLLSDTSDTSIYGSAIVFLNPNDIITAQIKTFGSNDSVFVTYLTITANKLVQ